MTGSIQLSFEQRELYDTAHVEVENDGYVTQSEESDSDVEENPSHGEYEIGVATVVRQPEYRLDWANEYVYNAVKMAVLYKTRC